MRMDVSEVAAEAAEFVVNLKSCWIMGPVKMYMVISIFLAISTDIRFAKKGLNRLEQVPNPSLGLALALASILAPNN